MRIAREFARPQTQFLPQPGAGSFKRVLGRCSAPLTAAGLTVHRRSSGRSATRASNRQGSAQRRCPPCGSRGGRPTTARSRTMLSPRTGPPPSRPNRSHRCAASHHLQRKRVADPCKREPRCLYRPNGPRLSCGRGRHGRTACPLDRENSAGAQTKVYPTWRRPPAPSAC